MKTIAIIGGGPAGLMLAAFLDPSKWVVHIYERNKAVGRKFLVAGKGGFNLTHNEALGTFVQKYQPQEPLKSIIEDFSNQDFRVWLAEIGMPTYVGSSHRVFPERGIKPIEVLAAIIKVLDDKGVHIHYNHTWEGWTAEGYLQFNEARIVKADKVVFALGGASWKVTGSAGLWRPTFQDKGISTVAFQPSNCAYMVAWPKLFIDRYAGKPLKNITITCGSYTQIGEAVITQTGIEGNAIYGLSPYLRKELAAKQSCIVTLDLKPTMTRSAILHKLEKSKAKNTTDSLRNDLNLSPAQLALVKVQLSKSEFMDKNKLATALKAIPIEIVGMSAIDEAISTVGGISTGALDPAFQLKQLANHYCIGEMVDWDAPTGGYLIQACVSMGVSLAKQLNSEK